MPPPNPIRLQKHLADCGLGSRRACEKLIAAGCVAVDGKVVAELGTKVDPGRQKVTCRGRPVAREAPVTILLNKPPGVICSSHDPKGRTRVIDLLENLPRRVYTVGRLDYMSEGLILVTNDGGLAHALTHPRHHVEKVYEVWLDAPLDAARQEKAAKGIVDQGETLRVLHIERGRRCRNGAHYTLTLGEGRNRHIRRMMEHLGRKVLRLRRVAIGPVHLGDLEPGQWRMAKPSEIGLLRGAAWQPASHEQVAKHVKSGLT